MEIKLCILFSVVAVLGVNMLKAEIVLVKTPQSVNAVHGTDVVFSCEMIAEKVHLVVNQTLANNQIVKDKGFIQSGVSVINGSILTRSLMVTVSVLYNNTNITCRGENVPPGMIESLNSEPPALLLVQGPLSSVVDLSYSFVNSLTVTISWSPPFTLPGTNITGYNISATSNGTSTNYFTSKSYYQLSLTDISDSPCEVITISVSGYNGLDGESTTLTGIYLPSSVTNEGTTLDVLPLSLNQVDNGVQLSSISINVSSICYGQYPTHINLTIQYSNNGSLVTTINDIPLVLSTNDTNILSTTNCSIILLPVDNTYTAIITYSSNLGGVFNISTIISISTHAVESVSSSNNISAGSVIVFECVFTPYLHANGCIITINNGSSSTLQYTSSGIRTVNNTASVVFCDIIAGVYTVSVYDDDQQSVPALQYTVTLVQTVQQLDDATMQQYCVSSTFSSTTTRTSTNVHGSSTTIFDQSTHHNSCDSQTYTHFVITSSISSMSSITSSTIIMMTTSIPASDAVNIAVIAGATSVSTILIVVVLVSVIIVGVVICMRLRRKSFTAVDLSESIYMDDPQSVTSTELSSHFDLNDEDGATSVTRILQDYDDDISVQSPTTSNIGEKPYDDFIEGRGSKQTLEKNYDNIGSNPYPIQDKQTQQMIYDDVVGSSKKQQHNTPGVPGHRMLSYHQQ